MQQAVVANAQTVTASPRRRDWLLASAKLCAVAGLTLSAASIIGWLLAVASGGGNVLSFVLWAAYWWVIAVAGLAGFWLAAAGLTLGIASHLVARRRGRKSPWTQFIVLVSVVALLATGCSVWLLHEPAYFLSAATPPTGAGLDALSPSEVVHTYFTAQDLSVEYRLQGDAGRAFWHDGNAVADVSLLAGVSDLRITPLQVGWEPNDATHRSFRVTYTSHATDSVDDPPGPQEVVVRLVCSRGGPWRISSVFTGG